MRQIRIIGLALAAMFALSAVVASAAFALSEFKTSKFPVTFTGKGGVARFQSTSDNIVECEDSESTGTVTGATAAEVTIKYLGDCKLKAESPFKFEELCHSPGEPSGVIKTSVLAAEPVDNLNGKGKAGLLIKAKSGNVATIECEGSNKVKIEVLKEIICESTPIGSLVTKGKVICKEGASLGVQEFTEATNHSDVVLKEVFLEAESTLSIFKLKELDAQNTTEELTYSAAIEQTA